ncbi:uncharacterized protein EAF01_005004 [Botrytis porri]|uniref:HNH nuclease domain-containing protein n=1 Tax=Botrytis porri TaxID=87229 RepID=A0A4Z1L6T7_9HELO|nr:uncharacterized protein EAF01_005004 [Botrytis porri]KAF7907418.1 hypothetical protein EAF01_005004 [Botrytis porri]TGO92428.1 hypothetical protein BPOR_0003g00260 [Botrytis porri]
MKEIRKKRKAIESYSTTTTQWPANAQVLREALREMDEQQEKVEQIERDLSTEIPMSEIHSRRRAWYRRKIAYVDAIQDSLLGRKRKAKSTKSEKETRLKKAHQAHTDLMLQLCVKEKKRSSTQQTEFRNRLIDFYGVKRQGLDEEEIWCVVSHSWGKSSQFVAAHIIPAKLQDAQMKHIFGDEASDELFSVKNGLMLEKQIETCFDNLQLAVVPCLTDPSSWELRVLDKHLLKTVHWFTSTRFEKLHGRKLAFLNENRPRKRYLYYHWLVCMSVAGQKKMNMPRIKEERERFTECWGTPGRYLREEMIAALIGYVGHKIPTEKRLKQDKNEDSCEEDEEDEDEEEDSDEDTDGSEEEDSGVDEDSSEN